MACLALAGKAEHLCTPLGAENRLTPVGRADPVALSAMSDAPELESRLCRTDDSGSKSAGPILALSPLETTGGNVAEIRVEYISAKKGEAAGAASWIETLARIGYASRGVLYIIIGALALALAMGSGGATTGSRGALQTIADQPLGTAALIVIALGLAGYAVWRLTEAFANPQHLGGDPKGIVRRIGYAVRAVIYGALAVVAVRIAMGDSSGSSSGETSAQPAELTARLMELPFGRWLLGLAGAIVIAYGVHRIIQAWRADIGKQIRVAEMSRDTSRSIIHVSRFGIGARGVVLVMIGWFLVLAAVQYDPTEAGGVAEALNTLARQSHGPWLLGIVALGLVAFGVHSLLQARYRRIDIA